MADSPYDEMAMAKINVKTWSGKVSIPRLYTLETRVSYVVDAIRLREFAALRQRAMRIGLRYGFRMLGGYLIPSVAIPEMQMQLDYEARCFKSTVLEFASKYPDYLDEYCARNKNIEQYIFKAAPPAEEIVNRFGFTWSFFRIRPIEGDSVDMVLDLIYEELDSFFTEFNRPVKRVTQPGFATPILNFTNKLSTFKFISEDIKNLVEFILSAVRQWVPDRDNELRMKLYALTLEDERERILKAMRIHSPESVFNGAPDEPLDEEPDVPDIPSLPRMNIADLSGDLGVMA